MEHASQVRFWIDYQGELLILGFIEFSIWLC